MHDGALLLRRLDALKGEAHDEEMAVGAFVGSCCTVAVGILQSRDGGLYGLQDVGGGGGIVLFAEVLVIVKCGTHAVDQVGGCLAATAVLAVQHLAQELLLLVGRHVAGHVGSAHQQATAHQQVAAQQLLKGGGEGLEGLEAVAVVALQTQQQVDDVIVGKADAPRLDGIVAAADDVVAATLTDGFGVRHDVVEVVAGNEHAGQLVAAVAQTAVLIAHLLAVEVKLTAYPPVCGATGDAGVLVQVEALSLAVVDDGGRGDAVEVVDNEHRVAGTGGIARREYLAGETLATLVDGRDAEVVQLAGGELQVVAGLVADVGAVVEVGLALGHVEQIASGTGAGLLWVADGLPADAYLVVVAELNAQVVGRQRSDGIREAVLVADVAQYSFIYGTREGETERGVLAIAHVGETLVRHGLEDGAGHGGQSRLGVVTVVKVAAHPVAVVVVQVGNLVVEQGLGKVVGCHAGLARVELAVVEVGGADGQRTVDAAAVRVETCVAVDGQREFDRDAAAVGVGHETGTAAQQVGHKRAYVDVVAVVVLALLRAVHLVGHAGPLGIVAGTLKGSGKLADEPEALYVAHAAAEADGIGGHHSVVGALVGYGDAVELAVARVEVEGAKIDPRRTAHLLVDMELGALAAVPDGVENIVDAVGKRGIADVDGVAASLLKVGLVGGQRVSRLGTGGLDHARCAGNERVLAIGVGAAMEHKTGNGGRLPLRLRGDLDVVANGTVVVDDDFLLLPVALTGSEDVGSGILEHGNEVGHYDGLGEEVLAGGKELGTLPAPGALLLVVEVAVAGPHGEMAALQTVGNLEGFGDVLYPGLAIVVNVAPAECVLVVGFE